jgi:diguanylate cyclase (GGDEF)-like protein/PAS domain S-box-containing protein
MSTSGHVEIGDVERPDLPTREALAAQLMRYAEDMGALLDQHEALRASHDTLVASYKKLDASQSSLERLIRSTREYYFITNHEGRISYANAAAIELIGQGTLYDRKLSELIPETERVLRSSLSANMRLGADDAFTSSAGFLIAVVDGSGKTRTLHVAVIHDHLPESGGLELHWMMRDESGAYPSDSQSHLSAMVFHNTAEGIMITDADGTIYAVNPAFTRITGYSEEEAVGQTPRLLSSGMQGHQFYREFWQTLREKGFWQGEIFNKNKLGEVYSEWLTVTAVTDMDGRVGSYVAVFSDLTPSRKAEKRLAFIAYHDTLTGLPNRALFLDRISQSISQARRTGQPLSLMFIDLDGFKAVNDTLGHKFGDVVLQQVAKRLSESIREADTAARFGGDEFVIILPGMSGKRDIDRLANKLLLALASPIPIEGERVIIGGSIGCAQYPSDADDDITLLRHADEAMFAAKRAGGNMYALYKSGLENVPDQMAELSRRIELALEKNQLELVFQPQFDASVVPPRLTAVEALLRWRDPDMDEISPATFLPVAERIGAMNAIGAWTLRQALLRASDWRRRGLPDLRVCVNVSTGHLRATNFVTQLQEALAESEVPADALDLEISEGDATSDIEGDQQRLTLLWSLGVSIAVDGYGSSSGTLRRLQYPPLARLKISSMLISAREDDMHARALCKAILGIGDALGIEVAAVGIESKEQYERLRQMGCQCLQGYFLARPMTVHEFEERYLYGM